MLDCLGCRPWELDEANLETSSPYRVINSPYLYMKVNLFLDWSIVWLMMELICSKSLGAGFKVFLGNEEFCRYQLTLSVIEWVNLHRYWLLEKIHRTLVCFGLIQQQIQPIEIHPCCKSTWMRVKRNCAQQLLVRTRHCCQQQWWIFHKVQSFFLGLDYLEMIN